MYIFALFFFKVWKRRLTPIRLQLHGAIYCPNSFVLMLRYCVNLKAIRYEPTSLNRIVADKSHRVIVGLYRHESAQQIGRFRQVFSLSPVD